jgi:hypothetical protein
MKFHFLLLMSLFFIMPAQADIASSASSAKVLIIKGAPKRGMSMKQVRKKFGKPNKIHKSKGKVKTQWPRITRWEYKHYSVYFERHIVLHTVAH